MPDSNSIENDFLSQITAIVENNISNEQFGVSELADAMNMSRSNLLRKVKKLNGLSVSQLISQVRLNRGMELLKTSSMNVSEVSHQVGFSSTSYFIKCFREYYGYPPGEVGKRKDEESRAPFILPATHRNRKRNILAIASALTAIIIIGLLIYYYTGSSSGTDSKLEKSIAVLPFKNDSSDSSNVYLINGLMESTLNNLQQIKDLKVISRTSAEKYRNTKLSIPEMAKELKVNYFVEGSGQKIGDQILLNIQLIEGQSDRHLWARQYRRETKDIFELQQEIARNIAKEIQAIITPEEEKRIEKKPTDDLVAYDLFLKGRDLFYESSAGSLEAAIPYFTKAIERDNKFGLAYANAVMVYYYLDIFQIEKKYATEINNYADKAMLHDPKSGESLIAKALSYAHRKDFAQAVPYLEKALEYNPNSGLVIHFLTEFYSMYVPNPLKYLQYAQKGVELDIISSDSATLSFKYFQLANAYIQAGFLDEGIRYVDMSLSYNPENYFARYVTVLFHFAKSRDLKLTKELLIKEFNKDTSRSDIVVEVGKISYIMRDYDDAYKYYKKFIELKEQQHLELFKEEYLSVAIVYAKMGFKEKSDMFLKSYKEFSDNDHSIYRHLFLGTYYAHINDTKKALEHLALFSKENNYQYWVLLLNNDPVVDRIKELSEFKKIMHDIETKFWDNHDKIKAILEENGK